MSDKQVQNNKGNDTVRWGLIVCMLCVYYVSILLIVFDSRFLGDRLMNGSMLTWVLPTGLSMIVFGIAATGFYLLKPRRSYWTWSR